ncbi:MAG: 2-C-methyl-D-erythritol 2,4-cyclodiphosphate synthase [Spirochaetales bacterium]|nr:2-C-methyl-D-erythritol 2,4-cyclodiphosphate synthase [Spirochaetales bacterium]
MKLRIGSGYDIHRLTGNRDLIIGGVKIPAHLGEEGHSDGDALIHAIIDALLGAISSDDIGTHFPPSDPKYKGMDSQILLKKTMSMVYQAEYSINNIDCTVILEKPKLLDYKQKIESNLASLLEITLDQISVKAKTKEGCDASGKGLAIECYACVLLTG